MYGAMMPCAPAIQNHLCLIRIGRWDAHDRRQVERSKGVAQPRDGVAVVRGVFGVDEDHVEIEVLDHSGPNGRG